MYRNAVTTVKIFASSEGAPPPTARLRGFQACQHYSTKNMPYSTAVTAAHYHVGLGKGRTLATCEKRMVPAISADSVQLNRVPPQVRSESICR